MKILCKKCNSQVDNEKWLPTPVDSYEIIVSRKIPSSDSDYRKAFPYGYQFSISRTNQLYTLMLVWFLPY